LEETQTFYNTSQENDEKSLNTAFQNISKQPPTPPLPRKEQAWKQGEIPSVTEQPSEQETYCPVIQMLGKSGEQNKLKLKSPQAKDGTVELIIDSGSTVSIMKIESLHESTQFFPEKRMILNGISGSRMSLGACFIGLKMGKKLVMIEFQLVHGGAPEQADGLIGKNVIKNASIDFRQKTFTYYDKIEESNEKLKKIYLSLADNARLANDFVMKENSEKAYPEKVCFERLINEKYTESPSTIQKIDEGKVEVDKEVKDFVNSLNSQSVKCLMISSSREKETQNKLTPKSRIETIMSKFSTEHLDVETNGKFKNLFNEFSEVFKLECDKLPATTVLEMNIPLKTKETIYRKQYNLTPENEEFVYQQALEWEKEGVIRSSTSRYNNPIVVVEKKTKKEDGTPEKRACTDLRCLNAQIVDAYYHTIPIHHLLAKITKSKFHTTLDLANGYLQINVCEEDKHKLAFTVKHRRFEFQRVPFGVKTASFCFTKVLAIVLDDLLVDKGIHIYLDDVLILANSIDEMVEKLRKILERFRKHTIRINPKKIAVCKSAVNYLGHIISTEGICPATDKTIAIQKIRTPKSIKDIQVFLATTNFFRQFIPDHSKLCEPLLQLLRKGEKFVWTEKREESFGKLKEALGNPPVLVPAGELDQEDAKTILMTDASNIAIGACLAILKDNEIKPVAYCSKILDKAQRNYSVYEREGLAIVEAITNKFPHILIRKPFYVLTDHKPLTSFMTSPVDILEGRAMRWRLKLQKYSFKILHVKGDANSVADTLSRLVNEEDSSVKTENVTEVAGNVPVYAVTTRAKKKEVETTEGTQDSPRKETEEDDVVDVAIKERWEATEQEKQMEVEDVDIENVYEERLPGTKLVKDRKQQEEIIELFHNHPLVGGHTGMKRGLMKLKNKFYWKGMNEMYINFVKSCEVCQRCKHKNKSIKVPLGTIRQGDQAYDQVFFDLVGPFEPSGSEGFKYILTAQCSTTYFTVSVCIVSKDTDIVAKALFDNVFLLYGFPRELTCDQAKEFQSDVMTKLCKLIKTRKTNCTIYNPKANRVERFHSCLKNYLRCFLTHEKIKSAWSDFVKLGTYVFNVTPHSRTGYSPYSLMFGRLPRDPVSKVNIPEFYTYDTFYDHVRRRIKIFNDVAKEKIKESKNIGKLSYDKNTTAKTFKQGEKCLIKNFVRSAFDDIFEIVEVIEDVNEQNVIVKRKNKPQTINKDKVFKLNTKEDENFIDD
jgi:RNase H-like domain found in reverse transcriptase/Reverse transcriptase (RNA-dependent DNA polymerase)/Integrase zinc binding domain